MPAVTTPTAPADGPQFDSERWAAFVTSIARTENTNEIARRSGISQTTVYRWLRGGTEPHPRAASAFARAHGISPLVAFIAAGWIPEDAIPEGAVGDDVHLLTNDGLHRRLRTLVDELATRARASVTEPGDADHQD